jgi:hypothetical protein
LPDGRADDRRVGGRSRRQTETDDEGDDRRGREQHPGTAPPAAPLEDEGEQGATRDADAQGEARP